MQYTPLYWAMVDHHFQEQKLTMLSSMMIKIFTLESMLKVDPLMLILFILLLALVNQ